MNETDLNFVKAISDRFPDRNILGRFNHVLRFDPPQRPRVAFDLLKMTLRAGWVRIGAQTPQTVYDHVFTMKRMCGEMGKVHDLAEGVTTDFTPHDPIEKGEKYSLERIILSEIYPGITPHEHIRLWEEYAQKATPEAKFAHDCDKLEMCLEALQIQAKQPDLAGPLNEFWDNTASAIGTRRGGRIFKKLQKSRTALEETGESLGAAFARAQGIQQLPKYQGIAVEKLGELARCNFQWP